MTVQSRSSLVTETPLVDSLILDPMSVPLGLTEWARGVEITARRARAKLVAVEEAPENQQPLAIVAEAIADIDIILDESEQGQLLRVLRRPPWQLKDGSAPRASLQRRVAAAAEFAREAVIVSEKVSGLLRRLADFNARFSERYANLSIQEIGRARIREEQVVNIRRLSEVSAADRRLSVVVKEFEKRDSALAQSDFLATTWTVSEDEEATVPELASTCALALLERERAACRRVQVVRDQTLSSHLNASLALAPSAVIPTETAGHALLLEDMLRRSLRLQGEIGLRGADAPLWGAALAVAADREPRYRLRPHGLRTSDSPTSTDEEPDHSYYFIPLGGDLVIISQTMRSAIRLWSARLALGLEVDGQVAPGEVSRHPELAAEDIAELFAGIREGSAWYKAHTKLRAKVVAHFPGGWLARVRRRGVVRRVPTTAWATASEGASDFRVLVAADPVSAEPIGAPDKVADSEGMPSGNGFAGFSTDEVRTSLAGDQLAWRRNASSRGKAAQRAVDAEWALMHRLSRASRLRASSLTPLAWSAGKSSRTRVPLYRMNIAITSDAPQFDKLVSLNLSWRLFTIRAIAKVVSEVHRHGFVLGTVHHAQFIYGAEPNGPGHLLVPRPVLSYAPAVCSVGEQHVGDTRLEHEGVKYVNLGVPLLNPFVAAGRPSEKYHDVYSFGVCALELLAKAPIGNWPISYVELKNAVHASADKFAHPGLAARIADSLAVGSADQWLVKLFTAMKSPLMLDAEAWLALT